MKMFLIWLIGLVIITGVFYLVGAGVGSFINMDSSYWYPELWLEINRIGFVMINILAYVMWTIVWAHSL